MHSFSHKLKYIIAVIFFINLYSLPVGLVNSSTAPPAQPREFRGTIEADDPQIVSEVKILVLDTSYNFISQAISDINGSFKIMLQPDTYDFIFIKNKRVIRFADNIVTSSVTDKKTFKIIQKQKHDIFSIGLIISHLIAGIIGLCFGYYLYILKKKHDIKAMQEYLPDAVGPMCEEINELIELIKDAKSEYRDTIPQKILDINKLFKKEIEDKAWLLSKIGFAKSEDVKRIKSYLNKLKKYLERSYGIVNIARLKREAIIFETPVDNISDENLAELQEILIDIKTYCEALFKST